MLAFQPLPTHHFPEFLFLASCLFTENSIEVTVPMDWEVNELPFLNRWYLGQSFNLMNLHYTPAKHKSLTSSLKHLDVAQKSSDWSFIMSVLSYSYTLAPSQGINIEKFTQNHQFNRKRMSCTVTGSSMQLEAATSNQQHVAWLVVAHSSGPWAFWLYVVAYAIGIDKADRIQPNW